MPIIFDDVKPTPRDPISLGAGEAAPIKVPGTLETLAAGFRHASDLAGAINWMAQNTFKSDPEHNPMDTIRGTKHFERFAHLYINSRSIEETHSIMARIDSEERDQQLLAAAGNAGVVASLAASMLSPTIFLPAGAVYRSARGGHDILRTARSFMLGGASQAVLQESILSATHETHGFGDAMFSVGTATILGGLLGGAVAKLTRAELRILDDAFQAERDKLGDHLAGNVAKATPDAPPLAPTREVPDGQVRAPMAAPAGAAAVDQRALDVTTYGLDKVPVVGNLVKRLFPDLRTYEAQGITGKRAMAELAETALLFDQNLAGETTTLRGGPALNREVIMFNDGTRVSINDEMSRLWTEVRYGDGNQQFPHFKEFVNTLTGGDNKALTYDQFQALVFDALNKGDRHEIPQVQAAAQFIRKNLFEKMGPRAEKAIPEFKMREFREGESYAPHMPDKDKIIANRPEAVEDITRWYAAQQEKKRGIQASLRTLAGDLEKINERIAKLEAKATAGDDAAVSEIVELQARAALFRTRIEEALAAWEGKSVNEAKSAIKAREKYAVETQRDPNAPRLTSADDAIDRTIKKIIASNRDLPVDELRARAQQTVDRWIGGPDGRLPYDVEIGYKESGPTGGNDLRGSLADRDFDLPYDIKRKWLVDDVEKTVSGYLNSVVPDVLIAERFGDIRMTEIFRKHNEEYAALIDNAKTEGERVRLNKERDKITADIAGVRDRIRNVYGFTHDPQMRNAARVAQGAIRANNLISGGMMAVSSLPDMAGVVFRHGFESAFADGWTPWLKAMSDEQTWGAIKKQGREFRAFGIGVETAIASRQRSIDDLTEMYRSQNRFERGLEFANDKMFVANLLAPFTDFQKRVAASVASANILRAVEQLTKGKATATQLRLLGESNINPVLAHKIWDEFQAGGETINGVHVPNTGDWKAQDAVAAFRGAVARDVDIAVITPGQEKAFWTSQPLLKPLAQFKNFMHASTMRIMIANLQRHDATALQGLVFSVGLGMLAYRIHSLASGTPVSERPQDWVKEGLSRSGVLGWMEEGNALASKGTRGAVDIYRLIGADKPLSRYANRNTADMILGPTWGKIQNILKVTGSAGAGEWSASDTHALRMLVATQNLLYTRMLFDQVENGINSAFGVPARVQ